MIENNTSSQKEESFMELQERFIETIKRVLKDNPFAWREIKQMLPDIVKTSEQAGRYMPVVFLSFLRDIILYYHCQERVQLSKKAHKLDKKLYRLRKERHEFNKLALSRGEIPDHIFQKVQECQKSEEQEVAI